MKNGWDIVKDFEQSIAEYTGAPYAVAVNSCTNALLLACKLFSDSVVVSVPQRTYPSVPMSVIHAGHEVKLIDMEWRAGYQLEPLPVLDYACRFTRNMYWPGEIQCISFAANKILGIEQGGAILHDDEAADSWLRCMRYDGRNESGEVEMIGYHCPMLPSIAAQGLLRMNDMPHSNPDIQKSYSCIPGRPFK